MNTMLNQVADGVWVRQSAWVWSNAIAVRGEGGLILVDPGIDGSELNQLADDLDVLGLPVGRNRPTCVWVKTGSPASTSRTWSRPDPQPDELSASSRHGRHPLVARTAVSSARPDSRVHRGGLRILRPLNSPLQGMHAHHADPDVGPCP